MPQSDSKVFIDFLKTSLVPFLINKAFMLYFGLNYSMYPGEGYGYGLVICCIVLLGSMARFVWKYKDVEDP